MDGGEIAIDTADGPSHFAPSQARRRMVGAFVILMGVVFLTGLVLFASVTGNSLHRPSGGAILASLIFTPMIVW